MKLGWLVKGGKRKYSELHGLGALPIFSTEEDCSAKSE